MHSEYVLHFPKNTYPTLIPLLSNHFMSTGYSVATEPSSSIPKECLYVKKSQNNQPQTIDILGMDFDFMLELHENRLFLGFMTNECNETTIINVIADTLGQFDIPHSIIELT